MSPEPIDIDEYLASLEYEYEIAILGAWDTGSHAWGLEGPESDYDIKIAYARPQSRYPMDTEEHTIETTGDNLDTPAGRSSIDPELIELAGWDAGYFAELLADSNPAILEALHSPITYRSHPLFAELREYTASRFNIIDLANHYRGLARSNYRKYITGNRPDEQTTKRTLNIIRALMYAEYAYETHEFPPLIFPDFLETAPETITGSWEMGEIADLIAKKTSGDGGEHIGNPFGETIERKLEELDPESINPQDHLREEYMDTGTLNEYIRELIQARLLTR